VKINISKNKYTWRFSRLIIPLFLLTMWLSACKSTREITTKTVKPIGTAKLLKSINQNHFDFNYFSVNRVSCQFSSNKSSASFKISLKIIKDKQILASITKLSIPVGRLLLSPDSVIYVNYIDRNYFIDDYSYLSNFLNIDLDFSTIQSILTNEAFSYRNDDKDRDFRTFTTIIEENKYVLQSEKQRKVVRLEEKAKPQKVDRYLKRLDDNALILQKMYFSPENFALEKLIILDKTNNRKMEMSFNDFEKIENKDYPGKIEMNFNSDTENVSLKVQASGFSTERLDSLSLNIPEKYEQIKVN